MVFQREVQGHRRGEPLTRLLKGNICGLVQVLQHGHPQLSRGAEGVLKGLDHLEAQEEHTHIHEPRQARVGEGQRAPAAVGDPRASSADEAFPWFVYRFCLFSVYCNILENGFPLLINISFFSESS